MAIDNRPPMTLHPQGVVVVPLERGPDRVQGRGPLYRDDRRTQVGGIYYGPFVLFSFNCSQNQTAQEAREGWGSPQLYLYMRAGDEWKLWTTTCGDEYMRRFAAQVGWRGTRGDSAIISQRALNSMASALRGTLINIQTGGQAQKEATEQRHREQRAKEDKASKGDTNGGGGGFVEELPPWAIPAGIGAGLLALVWYRRK